MNDHENKHAHADRPVDREIAGPTTEEIDAALRASKGRVADLETARRLYNDRSDAMIAREKATQKRSLDRKRILVRGS